jgi:hypothetical protein
VARHPHSLEARYNLACGLSVLGRHDEAMRELTTTVEDGWFNGAIASAAKSGWTNVTDIAKDEDFSPLREREDFQQLVARGKDHLVHMPLARGFDASVGWDAVGRRCAPYKGSRYFLSTMLGYTSGRGNSYAEVLGYLRRAQAADATQPKGTVYYLLNDNVRSDCREWAVSGAVARLRESGVNASVETGKIPQGKDDVMGLMAGTDTFDWPGSGSTILPGAICEHLTSYGGIMDEKSSQTPLSVFLAAGAAGASGSVAEPHAIQAKFPTAFIQAYYAEGCSLAEAFYQAVTGPYQLLIVGDPLCQPWARPPAVVVEGLTPNETVKGDVKVTVSLAEGSEPAQVCHLHIDGRRFATVRIDEQVDLPTARLSEGYHDLRAVAVAANAIQTQGRAVVPFVVKNLGRDLPSLPLEQTVFRYGERIPFSFDLPDVEKLDVFCHLGRLGGLDSGQGTVHVDTTMLGLGTVALRFGLVYSDSTRFSCPPVEVTILPPEPLALPADSLPAAFEPGIQVLTKLDGTKKETTAASLSGDWLEQGGGADGASFAARGYFDVPIGGVYQFQFQGNVLGSCRVKVDDQTQPIPAGEGWRSMLVSLTKGTHSLTLSGSCVDAPRLHVRFGGPGCRTVSEKTFRRGVAQ